jgi:hypothetical protein
MKDWHEISQEISLSANLKVVKVGCKIRERQCLLIRVPSSPISG